MSTLKVRLTSPMSDSFYATRAANSLDIDVKEKSVHELTIEGADLQTPFNIGLIVGASGSGKTTLAVQQWGEFKTRLRKDVAVIDQFPETWSYDERSAALCGIGLSSVPQWLKPAGALSNGQQARAEAALAMAYATDDGVVVLDEWTSVVDRTVAKAMSYCVQKWARKSGKKIVLLSCHYDVVEWLAPDWIIDCNSQRYENRRSLRQERSERLQFEVREVPRSTWARFSKYHYLSEEFPGGLTKCYGLFHDGEQIGFQCFANYIPIRKGSVPIYHSNRVVIHPDYVGLGLGLRFINECCREFKKYHNGRVVIRAKFSSIPLYKSRLRDTANWRLDEVKTQVGLAPPAPTGTIGRSASNSFRANVKFFRFTYIGP